MKLLFVPCAGCPWRSEGRILGRVEVPPEADADAVCREWAELLASHGVTRILHSTDELATHTARLLGKALKAKVRGRDGLIEVDMGLWSGLTADQLESRFESAHHELGESPLNVSPPEGESFRDAYERITADLAKGLSRVKDAAVAVVLRPVALAMARSWASGEDTSGIWRDALAAWEPAVVDRPQAQRGADKLRTRG